MDKDVMTVGRGGETLSERRRHARQPVTYGITVRSRLAVARATMVDVSRGGARFDLIEPMAAPLGGTVVLGDAPAFRGGIDARIVTRQGARCHVAFDPTMIAVGFDPTKS